MMEPRTRLEQDRQRVAEFLASPAQRWDRVQEQLDTGIQKGISAADRSFTSHLTQEERAEIYSTAVEKAFRGLMEQKWQGKSALEHWAYRIGYNATVDLLRQRNRNPLYQASSLEFHDTDSQQSAPKQLEQAASMHTGEPDPTPEDQLYHHQKSERMSSLRRIVEGWSEPERSMALMLLNEEDATLTSAARAAAACGHKMYLTKARSLLQRRLRDFKDLI